MKLKKFTKDTGLVEKTERVNNLPPKGEKGTLYLMGDKEYMSLNDEWVYFITTKFLPPIINKDFRPDPSSLAHGTCVMDLETMDVYVVLDGCWECFPMHNFISEEVLAI